MIYKVSFWIFVTLGTLASGILYTGCVSHTFKKSIAKGFNVGLKIWSMVTIGLSVIGIGATHCCAYKTVAIDTMKVEGVDVNYDRDKLIFSCCKNGKSVGELAVNKNVVEVKSSNRNVLVKQKKVLANNVLNKMYTKSESKNKTKDIHDVKQEDNKYVFYISNGNDIKKKMKE